MTIVMSEMMTRAISEARKGLGKTHPNPMVGCVVVRNGQIVATGHHPRLGAEHAEVMALRRAGAKARGADVYVTLEPCHHVGRTGPCTKALVDAGVGRVIVGMRDPHSIVNGRGLRALRQAGIDVRVGEHREACQELNEAYCLYRKRNRPFVHAKFAQSLDGRVATRRGESKWITGEVSRRFGHRLRREVDAIMVGIGTVLADNPQLTCRVRDGIDPLRIVMDCHARTPLNANVIRAVRESAAETVVVVGEDASPSRCRALEKQGASILVCRAGTTGIDVKTCLESLGKKELVSILVEGGPRLLGSFVDAELVDRAHLFVGPFFIGGRDALGALDGLGVAKLNEVRRLKKIKMKTLGQDIYLTGSF